MGNGKWSWRSLAWPSVTLALLALAGCATGTGSAARGAALQVVAGENFWGSIAAQLGGAHVSVTSVISDPNADPHQYLTSVQTAREFATANYVILNGAGYDSWAQNALSANPVSGRKVLTVATLLGKKAGDNPHFWYDPTYVTQVANRITADYTSLDPANASYYAQQNTQFLNVTLKPYHDKIAAIKAQFAGRKVGSTESIFVYMANALGLDLISPPTFMDAVAEGNDPPAAAVAAFQQQLEQRQISVLVYNTQTSTNVTSTMRQLAAQQHIPVIGISETLQPVGATFQDWQLAELNSLQNALAANAPVN